MTRHDQTMAALARANKIRCGRAVVKRAVREREITFAQACENPVVAKMTVMELMLAVPRYGRVRARGLLQELRISEHRKIDTLTPRQREALSQILATPGRRVMVAA